MIKTTLTAAAFLASMAPAFAGSVSPGAEQLARSLGVEPGLYSFNQLIRIDAAMTNNRGGTNDAAIARILADPQGPEAPVDMTMAAASTKSPATTDGELVVFASRHTGPVNPQGLGRLF